MEIFKTVADVRKYIAGVQQNSTAVLGFVPTMGALHQGHVSLIEECKKQSSLCICSIFVNPIQFNNPEDLKRYPRTPDQDIRILENAGCDVLFMPDVDEVFPEKSKEVFDLNGLDTVMEGRFRPGHFNGVAVVVKRLFEIVEPHKAFFGEKDFQQFTIISYLVKKLKIPVKVIPCPTVRESNGLALSSRNSRLTSIQRNNAAIIYDSLSYAKANFGKIPVNTLTSTVEQRINATQEMKLEYFEIVDNINLRPIDNDFSISSGNAVACIAVYVGEVRLIDNIKI